MRLRTVSLIFLPLFLIDAVFIAYVWFMPDSTRFFVEQNIAPYFSPWLSIGDFWSILILSSFVYAIILGTIYVYIILRHVLRWAKGEKI